MGGGGGNSQTTTSQIDPDIKKRVLPVLGDVGNLYGQTRVNELGQRESLLAPTADQSRVRGALGVQDELARDVLDRGLSQQVATDLQNFSGQQQTQGGLNSARQQRANAAGLADRSLQLRQADLAAREQAAKGLTATAEAGRALDQEKLDAPHTAAQRYFGYLTSAPGNTTQKSSGGGGK